MEIKHAPHLYAHCCYSPPCHAKQGRGKKGPYLHPPFPTTSPFPSPSPSMPATTQVLGCCLVAGGRTSLMGLASDSVWAYTTFPCHLRPANTCLPCMPCLPSYLYTYLKTFQCLLETDGVASGRLGGVEAWGGRDIWSGLGKDSCCLSSLLPNIYMLFSFPLSDLYYPCSKHVPSFLHAGPTGALCCAQTYVCMPDMYASQFSLHDCI